MTFKFSKKSPLLWLYVGGALLLIAALWVWCFKISVAPERVFWATIERGLTTRGVTIDATQDNGGTKAKQLIRFSLGAENMSHSLTTLTQGKTRVVNEMIGVPGVDYTRYVSIKTDQRKRNGGKMDFSKLLGVWAKSEQGVGQFFSQAVVGGSLPVGGMGVPLGNLNPKDRAALIKQIREDFVYQIDFDKVKRERVNGRLLYTYDAKVQAVAYVAAIKRFIQSVGLHVLDEINPGDFKGQKPFELKITVDARARQVVTITDPEGLKRQAYSGYGVPVQVEPPSQTISGSELQKRLNSLQ